MKDKFGYLSYPITVHYQPNKTKVKVLIDSVRIKKRWLDSGCSVVVIVCFIPSLRLLCKIWSDSFLRY